MSQQGRRLVVCVVWFAVGLLLIWRGLPYAGLREVGPAETLDFQPLSGNDTWIALGAGALLGIGKGLSALKKGARRAVSGIVARGERAPFWTVFSPAMLLLVGLMVGAGLALRLSPYDPGVKGWIIAILYPGIGLALMIGGLLALRVEPLPSRK